VSIARSHLSTTAILDIPLPIYVASSRSYEFDDGTGAFHRPETLFPPSLAGRAFRVYPADQKE